MDPARPTEGVALDADVVVVGSGAGGGVVAAELAAAGRSVVVLEAGPFVDESTMPTGELEAFDRLYLDRGLVSTWDGSVTILAGSAVGGGTLVNWMTSIEAPAAVREEWARDHGLEGLEDGAAWSEDVAAVEAELGVAESTRIPPKDAILLRGARALGWEAAPTRRDAAGCGDCGSCPFGCRRGAKQSGIRAHLATAAAAGARIVPGRGRRAGPDRARARRRRRGAPSATAARLTVRAGTVVLAAGALRTPAILQRTRVAHPAIGRYLRLHPVPVLAGWFDEPVDMWRGTMQAARSLQFAAGEPGRNGYAIESAPGHPGLLALALPWEGRAAHADVMRSIRMVAPLIAVTRDGGEGRLRLTGAGRPRIDYRLDATGVATMRHAARADGPHRPGGRRRADHRGRHAAALARRQDGRPRRARRPRSRASSRTSPPSTSPRTAAPCSRRTRWARSGWAPRSGRTRATRGAASGTAGAATTSSVASTSATARSSRRGSA